MPNSPEPSELTWDLPGPARSPAKTATLIALVPLSAAIGLVWTRSPIFALLGPAFLAPVLSRYFQRPKYRLTAESAQANWGTGQTEIRWENVRCVIPAADSIRLSPVAVGDFRAGFRGVELLLPNDAELRERIQQFISNAVSEDVARVVETSSGTEETSGSNLDR